MLAYERKAAPPEQPPLSPPRSAPLKKGPYKKSPTSKKEEGVLVFHYPDGESALAAVKKAIKENRTLSFSRNTMEDGTDCFEVSEGGKVLERHCVG